MEALRSAPTSAGYSLSGDLAGEPPGSVTLVVNGDLIVGEARTADATYTIRSSGHLVEIRETDEGALPDVAEPETPPPAPAGAAAAVRDLPVVDLQPSTGITQVDVLVVYTTAAREAAGGEAAIEAEIDLWVAATNGYFAASGVNQRIGLAHVEELDYVETASSYELSLLRGAGDGFMDEVHALRDAVGADLVHLVERWGADGPLRYCGIAYVMRAIDASFQEYAFGATALACGSVVFAHELGHNMGLNHDRYTEDINLTRGLPNRPHAHAYGYVNQETFAAGAPLSSRWVTIMAYRVQCSHWGIDCSRVGRFSNPASAYSGAPAGIWMNGDARSVTGPADAAATLNETRTTVAGFRSLDPAPQVVSLKRRLPVEERTNSDVLRWRLAFSRDVSGVTSDDFDLSGSGLGPTTVTVTAKTGSQRIYDLEVTAGVDSFDGQVTLDFALGQDIESLAGVALVTTWPSHAERTYELDNTSPAPSISPANAGSSPFLATISFPEDVTGFADPADITATDATITVPSRSDARTYTVQVTPTTMVAGTITLSVPAAAASDLAGNETTAASRDVAWDPSTAVSLTVGGLSGGSTAENAQWTSATPSVTGTPSGTVLWTKEGADADRFTIDAMSGVLVLPGQNFEEPADADGDNAYEVTARATDSEGNSAVAAVTVTVTDAVEARNVWVSYGFSRKIPHGSGYSTRLFLDCGSLCRAAGGAIDPVTWTKAGADQALFTLDSATGALSLGARDFGAPEGSNRDNVYEVIVGGTDADGNAAATRVVVQVIEAPPGWLAVSGVSAGSVVEGNTWRSASPSVGGASGNVVWTKEGPDAARFSVGFDGVLTLGGQAFHNPVDANRDNVYEVRLRATDEKRNSGTVPVAVAVTRRTGGGGGGPAPPPPDDEDDEEEEEPQPPPPPPPPELSVSPAEASERAGVVTFDVRLSRSTSREVTVDYGTADGAGRGDARAGVDYTATAGTLSFAPGSRAEEIRVPVTDDGRYEAEPETFTLTLSRPRNARLAGGGPALRVTGTIHDDDDGPPMAAFEVAGAACDDELCRALTGTPVRFSDTSTGKVLSRQWDFGDGRASRSSSVEHSWSSPGFYEVTLSVSDGTTSSTASRTFLVEASDPAGTCEPDAQTRCLQDSRYAVWVEWHKGDGESGRGAVVPEGTNDSGLFRFFSRENWEILIKVLDGCAINGHVWVYAASTTDLGYTIRVTDTVTGVSREYRNEPGLPAPAITDATAFPGTCPLR
ncbi:MAG: PKD domain-containing protein [Acidobacteria bacterium]|nr:PKD domain-containing protein [Acidobacteriota bacterium]